MLPIRADAACPSSVKRRRFNYSTRTCTPNSAEQERRALFIGFRGAGDHLYRRQAYGVGDVMSN
jgi:hypothetical protein